MNINHDNKVEKHPIPKEYLKNKLFSYKFYINYIYLSHFNKVTEIAGGKTIDRYEYEITKIIISKLIKMCKVSRTGFDAQMKNKPYRMKIDDDGVKHLRVYTPKRNFTTIPNTIIEKILDLDEITIRSYIFIHSYSYSRINGLTYNKLLTSIGYGTKSDSIKTKLKKGLNNLVELGLIDRKLEYEGVKTYYIYYKK